MPDVFKLPTVIVCFVMNTENPQEDVKTTNEKQMQNLWKGKFEIKSSGTSIPLIYKIVQSK